MRSYIRSQLPRIDYRYFITGGTYLSIGQLLASMSGFILTIVLTQAFSPTAYGFYSYIFSIAGLLTAFTLPGMDTAVAQAVSQGREGTIKSAFWFKFWWSIPAALCVIGAGVYYLFANNYELGYALIVIGCTTPPIYAMSVYGAFYNGKKEFKKIAQDNIQKNILTTIAMGTAAFYTQSVLGVVIAFFSINFIISLIRFTKLMHTIDGEGNADARALSFGKHLSVMDVFTTVATHIDKLLIFQLLGATPLALYSLALAPVKQMQGITKLIRTLMLPRFSEQTAVQIYQSLWKKFWIVFCGSMCLVATYWVSAPYIFTLLFPAYVDALPLSQVLALILLCIPFILLAQALTSLHKKRELYILHVSKPFIKSGLLLLLVPLYGVWGAVWALLSFYVVHCILLTILYGQSDPRLVTTTG